MGLIWKMEESSCNERVCDKWFLVSTLTPLPPWVRQLIRWGFPAELPLHIQPLGGRESGY